MSRSEWYAVRCVFEMHDLGQPHTYEERITLWRAGSGDEAIDKAEAEAVGYAEGLGEYLGLAQSFHLFNEPLDRLEVFSLMRDSDLRPDEYLSRFFSAGAEHQRPYGE